MANTLTRGYTFGSAELVTNAKLHALVDSGTATIDTASFDSLTLTAAPASDAAASGIKISLVAGSNVAFGDICYINSSGKAVLADASGISTSSAVVMATGTISTDATGTFLLHGVARKDAWNWTVGGLVYLTITGTSTNTLSQTPPSGTDEVIQVIGVATHADRIYFNPSLSQVEHV